MSAIHSTAATIDTAEGWTFADNHTITSEFPTTTNDNWGIPATTTNNWDAPPTAPTPPLEQSRTDNHASLHWTACYDDYCGVHRQMKDNNYYPRENRRSRRPQICDCPLSHPEELLQITRERRLNPRKACADWHKGKRACPDCRFLVRMENHHLRCSAAPLVDPTPPQQDQEAATIEHAPEPSAMLQDEQLALLTEVVTLIHQTTTQDALRHHVAQRTLEQRMDEFHDADQQRLQGMTQALAGIVTEQQRLNEQLQARQQASRAVRIYRSPIRRRAVPTRRDLAGASVWAGGVLSRTWRDRLLGATAGAVATLASLWLTLVSAATATIILRA
jgi:hypothetical protein